MRGRRRSSRRPSRASTRRPRAPRRTTSSGSCARTTPHVAPEDLSDRSASTSTARRSRTGASPASAQPGEPKVRVYNPNVEEHGWQSPHTRRRDRHRRHAVPRRLGRDGARRGTGSAIHLLVHPTVMRVRRDDDGRLLELRRGTTDGLAESLIHVEIDRQTEPARARASSRADLVRVLGDVRAAVEDWPAMRERVARGRRRARRAPPPVDPDELRRGARRCSSGCTTTTSPSSATASTSCAARTARTCCAPSPGSGLGILRAAASGSRSRAASRSCRRRCARLAREPHLLNLTKANSRATVHRPAYLDYVGVKRFDARRARSSASAASSASTRTPPTARARARSRCCGARSQRVVERAGFAAGQPRRQGAGRDPRDLSARRAVPDRGGRAVRRSRSASSHLGERQRVRLFVRRDAFGRFLSCLVYLPRDRYNTEHPRADRSEILARRRSTATSVDFSARVSESVLARLHFVVRTDAGRVRATYDVARDRGAARRGDARAGPTTCATRCIEQLGEERGADAVRALRRRVPARPTATTSPRAQAVRRHPARSSGSTRPATSA